MNKPEFITYQKFNDPALAEELMEQLENNGITYQYEEVSSGFDPSMVMSNAPVDYIVRVKSADFEKVNLILEANELQNLPNIEVDYYLFAFTDEELIDVIAKADEWSAFDVVLARKILADRGKILTDELVSSIHERRIEELTKPEQPHPFWVTIGYIFAMLGGALGFFIGWHLYTYKKIMPNGDFIYGYNQNDRKQGLRIFLLSFLGLAIAFAIKLIAVI